jgi:hypothetical protein
MHDLRNVGGTRGGLGWFLGGLAMLAVGVYLLFQQVDVHGGYWRWGGWGSGNSFGLTLVPLLVGIGILFYDGSSKVGWIVAGLGLLIIVAGIVANLQIHFRRATLFDTVLILVLIAGGIGVIVRSLRPAGGGSPEE